MRQLSEVWFGTEKTTPLYDELTEFIVDSGTYGTIKNYHASHVVELGGKNQKSFCRKDTQQTGNYFFTI